ncbi:MAG: NYN domain-containing protein [Chromatiales bacterium]|nr:NYN domain-containing protein [Chromatiales bacterium]
MKSEKLAIFVDVENLTHWVKNNGPSNLISEMSSVGQSIVRRAYGNWTNQNLQQMQMSLTQQGFELIHNYHPVSGKNSSDIQLTIDVMEHALRLQDVEWIILATGDSDFSPLFRKLREMGKEVVGVGPRSPLSESVKTSCSRYIYTDSAYTISSEVLHSAMDDAIDLAEKAFESFGGPVLCSALKEAMTNIDSAFDEKSLGYKSFTDFLKNVESIKLHFDQKSCVWTASPMSNTLPASNQKKVQAHVLDEESRSTSLEERYRRLLRKKNWRTVPKKVLGEVYRRAISLEPLSKNELKEALVSAGITPTDVNKAISILFKAHLFEAKNSTDESEEERLFKLVNKSDYIHDVDVALLARLVSEIKDVGIAEDEASIQGLLYGEYNSEELKKILSEAKSKTLEFVEQDAPADRS